MSHPRQIMLYGGPMHNVCHELWFECVGVPDRIGLPIDNESLGHGCKIAWYRISCGTGIYMWTKDDEE